MGQKQEANLNRADIGILLETYLSLSIYNLGRALDYKLIGYKIFKSLLFKPIVEKGMPQKVLTKWPFRCII